jgi:Immunity protein 10
MTAPRAVTIRLVGESMEDSVYSVGVAEDVDVGDETFALIFSEGLRDDGEGYCVVAEPGQRTEYRPIESCERKRSAMRLVLTSHAAAVLDLPRELVLELDVSEADVARLERGLRRVGVPVSAPWT